MDPERVALFAVERTRLPDSSVRVAVAGVVDAENSCDFLACLVGGIVPGGRLIVDLVAATEIDETGMAALAMAEQLAELHNGAVQVVAAPARPSGGWARSGPSRSTRPGSDGGNRPGSPSGSIRADHLEPGVSAQVETELPSPADRLASGGHAQLPVDGVRLGLHGRARDV
jgi:hypothetical protein